MNLFNQLNHRYGQICIEEVRSWEGKEQKLARHKCHLHFNLRCLSQNIVPKGVKLNIKQFSMFQERKIICRTHRSTLNSRVRYCNRIINKLQTHIEKTKASIKNKFNNKDFKEIVEVIHKSREKVFKTTKNHQIKKFNHLQQQPRYRNMPVPDIIRKKWVINLSSKPLSDGEQSILQKGPKFAVSASKVPITEYIAVTKRICDELGGKHHWKRLYRNLPENQGSSTTLQGKKGAHPQHHQAGEGGHQNPQGRLLLSSTHSRQGCGLGGHGQKSIH